jgi:hypothetical protein
VTFYAIVRDSFEPCPGELQFGPYGTRKEAQWAAEREIAAAAELFTDGRAKLSYTIINPED